jgi:tetratricopeptide (TPR) repeat protein
LIVIACPTPDQLLGYVAAHSPLDDRQEVASHVDGCEGCRRAVVELLGSSLLGGDPDPGAAPLRRGDVVGRYQVMARIGEGGMGVVYAAHDPELDRGVALKLLRPDVAVAAAAEIEPRLRREARTMARLDHPNLVTVFDIGTHHGRLFLAMELLPGTLKRWLDGRPPAEEILRVLIEAGRGLEAAHVIGLVHRDFKPDNVLLTAAGRARVTDFGLAAVSGQATPPNVNHEDSRLGITRTGQLLGTPFYMAPEQLRGERADARADQFSFCVTLYEALWGERPFDPGPAPTVAHLEDAIHAGRVREPPRSAPHWLRRVVLRGLSAAPEDRFPSMTELLAALSPKRGRRLRPAAAGVALAAVVVGGTWAAVRHARAPMCPAVDGRALLPDVAARALVNTAARGVLVAYAESWARARLDACEATRVRGEQSDALLDARMSCLDDRALEVRALVAQLTADASLLEKNGAAAAAALSPLSVCADRRILAGLEPAPRDPARRARWDSLRHRLAEVKADYDTGQYDRAAGLAATALSEARLIGHAPLLAQTLFLLGQLQATLARPKEAGATLEEAIQAADAARDDRTRAMALERLVLVRQAEDDATALERAAHEARAVVTRLDGSEDVAFGLEVVLGAVDFSAGRLESALGHESRAVSLGERAFGKDDRRLIPALNNCAGVLNELNRYEDARAHFQRGLTLSERALGPEHPETAQLEANYANLLGALGRNQEALARLAHALPALDKGFGQNSKEVAAALSAQASALRALGRNQEALIATDRALAITTALFGPDHGDSAMVRLDRVAALRALGRFADAARELAATQKVAERAFAGNAYLAAVLLEKARLELDRHERRAAQTTLGRARALSESLKDASSIAAEETLAGDLAWAEGDAPRAARAYEAAIVRYAALPPGDPDRASAAVRGRDRARQALPRGGRITSESGSRPASPR